MEQKLAKAAKEKEERQDRQLKLTLLQHLSQLSGRDVGQILHQAPKVLLFILPFPLRSLRSSVQILFVSSSVSPFALLVPRTAVS
jgi:hypothetical protein